MNMIAKDNEWNIYRAKRGFIVHNSHFTFKEAHTHVGSMKTVNDIILMCKLEKVPRHWPIRTLESIRRVANPDHADEVALLLEIKRSKNPPPFYKKGLVR